LALERAQTEHGLRDTQKLLQFVYPVAGGWHQAFCVVKATGVILHPQLDVGLIEFHRRPDEEFETCKPVTFATLTELEIGDSIGVCGYPWGKELLERDGRVARFGPVFQQGSVSALAPFDRNTPITEILLDVRTINGMSGSPVFRPEDGNVVGVLWGGKEPVVSLAVPLENEIVSAMVTAYDEGRASGPGTVTTLEVRQTKRGS
jgi:hypothetical protein